MKDVNPVALFRLSVLGPPVSREHLARGELKALVCELASREYAIPGSDRRHVGEKTIEAWLYAFRRGGIDALTPKTRRDHGVSKIPSEIQEAILAAKGDNPRRSIRMIRQLLESAGSVPRGGLSRSSIHRLLAQKGLSRIPGDGAGPEERRSFTAEYAGSLWYGDVLHGPKVPFMRILTIVITIVRIRSPRVSDDNAFVEFLFRTAKYRPEFPKRGFATLEQARAWAAAFVHWYNHDHAHSGIRYVSPAQRHAGEGCRHRLPAMPCIKRPKKDTHVAGRDQPATGRRSQWSH